MTSAAGVDGCPKGWIAIVLENGHFARAELASTFTELLPHLTDAQVIAVDIPLGLPDGREPRKADVEASGLLGSRRSSVFTTPPRRESRRADPQRTPEPPRRVDLVLT